MGRPAAGGSSSSGADAAEKKKLLQALAEGRADAQREFEMERARVLDALSPEYRSRIGQIVFAKWKKESLPALILSPYSVPPGPVRTLWMNKFEKVRRWHIRNHSFVVVVVDAHYSTHLSYNTLPPLYS